MKKRHRKNRTAPPVSVSATSPQLLLLLRFAWVKIGGGWGFLFFLLNCFRGLEFEVFLKWLILMVYTRLILKFRLNTY